MVTWGGTITGVFVMNGGKKVEKWVRKSIGPIPTFDTQKEMRHIKGKEKRYCDRIGKHQHHLCLMSMILLC